MQKVTNVGAELERKDTKTIEALDTDDNDNLPANRMRCRHKNEHCLSLQYQQRRLVDY